MQLVQPMPNIFACENVSLVRQPENKQKKHGFKSRLEWENSDFRVIVGRNLSNIYLLGFGWKMSVAFFSLAVFDFDMDVLFVGRLEMLFKDKHKKIFDDS